MGDHRADIKISLTFPDGVEHKMDAWLNYWPYEREDGVDYRVAEFFRKAWEEWLWTYQEGDRRRAAEEAERMQRAEYERLKVKYESSAGKE